MKYRKKIDRSEFENLSKDIQNKIRRSEKDYLEPYFIYEKFVFLRTLKILRDDTVNEYTILKPKPGDFKTHAQIEKGNAYLPFKGSPFSIADFRSNQFDFDFVSFTLTEVFHKQEYFDIVYNFYKKNFERLKFNYIDYYQQKQT